MIKSRFRWPVAALVLMLALPVMAQELRSGEIAAAAQIYGYNLAEGNWTASPARCAAMPEFILLHYHRGYPDGAESNFTALVPRSMGHIHIVPVLYHGATPFVPAPRNPRNLALFNSLAKPITLNGPNQERRWLERASCYAEMTGGNDFISDPGAVPGIAGQPSPTVRVTIEGKTARVLFAERDSYHTYRLWSLLFSRDGKIKSAQTQEQSVYAAKIARSNVPAVHPEIRPSGSTEVQPTPNAMGETAKESASRPAQLSTHQAQQQASIEPEQPAPAAPVSPRPSDESQSVDSQNASAQPSQPGWKLILNPPQPPSKFIPNATPPPGTTVPNPPSSPQ